MRKSFKSIVCIGLITLLFNSCKKDPNSETADPGTNRHEDYIEQVSKNISKLNPERKQQRKKWLNELKKNPVYIDLVDSAMVSVDYLPTLNAISDAIKNSFSIDGSSQFGISEEIAINVEKSNNGDNKMNFVVAVSSLSLQMNGGMPSEIVTVFERYRSKYNLYGVANTNVYESTGKSVKIEKPFNISYAFSLFDPKDEKVLDAIYESVQKGVSQWKESSEQVYENGFMALKSEYMKHLKKVYPDSPYLIDVDFEITAPDLYQAYDANEVSADEQYKGKKIAVTGIIGSIGKDVLDNPYVSLEVGYLKSVNCYFSDENNEIISQLGKGEKVTIIGKCKGFTLRNVVIQNCLVN